MYSLIYQSQTYMYIIFLIYIYMHMYITCTCISDHLLNSLFPCILLQLVSTNLISLIILIQWYTVIQQQGLTMYTVIQQQGFTMYTVILLKNKTTLYNQMMVVLNENNHKYWALIGADKQPSVLPTTST